MLRLNETCTLLACATSLLISAILPFFLFDGSKLLLNLSKDPADRKIVLAAISRCDLRDLQLLDYFYLVHDMAAKGEDTTAAAFHILEEPKFQIFIPQHSLTLAQNYSLVYMLIPTDQDRKSTRLNSSHLGISYAVFCLKKK